MAAGYASGTIGQTAMQAEKSAREATLNDRLNKVADLLQFQCERLEGLLSRVNGTPPQAPGSCSRLGDVTPIKPTHALAQVVEMIEASQARLADLATGIERIA